MGAMIVENSRGLDLSVEVAPVVLVEMTGDIVWPFTEWQGEQLFRPRAIVKDTIYAFTGVYAEDDARKVQDWIDRFVRGEQ